MRVSIDTGEESKENTTYLALAMGATCTGWFSLVALENMSLDATNTREGAHLYFLYPAGQTAGLATRVLWTFTRYRFRASGTSEHVRLGVRVM